MRGPEIVVRGAVGDDVAEVWLALESRGGKILATRTIRPVVDADLRSATFVGGFPVVSARTTGRMFVMATAVDADGVPVAATRRRILISPIIDADGVPSTAPAQ